MLSQKRLKAPPRVHAPRPRAVDPSEEALRRLRLAREELDEAEEESTRTIAAMDDAEVVLEVAHQKALAALAAVNAAHDRHTAAINGLAAAMDAACELGIKTTPELRRALYELSPNDDGDT